MQLGAAKRLLHFCRNNQLFVFIQLDSELRPTNQLDMLARSILQDLGSTTTTVEDALVDPIITKYINDGMFRANEESVSRAAKVQVSSVTTMLQHKWKRVCHGLGDIGGTK